MITYKYGDLLKDDAYALVNPVNCFGVSGRGLAKQFASNFREMQKDYERACRKKEVEIGRCHVWRSQDRLIINLPTKEHWKNPSRLEWIIAGLTHLHSIIKSEPDFPSIALPALGCGNGGLNWSMVEPCIQTLASELPEVSFRIYPPMLSP